MARSRMIRPEAPHDQALIGCSIQARFVWAYLPCHADRDGRLEDKPFELKMAILPCDAVDMDALLDELANARPRPLITRYEVDGERFIELRTFRKHQQPHWREAPSRLPPAPVTPRYKQYRPLQGALGSPQASPGPALGQPQASPAVWDPDPVTDPVTVEEPPAPRAGAIPVARSTGQATGHALMRWFGESRTVAYPGTLPWVTPRDARGHAAAMAAALDEAATADVRPTMALFWEHVKAGDYDQAEEMAADVSFAFACWHTRFASLREELHGKAPPAPPKRPGKNGRGERDIRFGSVFIGKDKPFDEPGEKKI